MLKQKAKLHQATKKRSEREYLKFEARKKKKVVPEPQSPKPTSMERQAQMQTREKNKVKPTMVQKFEEKKL